jgi:predicted anti-sigma-YlaC factor YlaD
MKRNAEQLESNAAACPRAEIAAYLDGELSATAEAEFEKHLADCKICAERLNEQKRLLCALDFAFDDEKSFELPPNFARTVAIQAESDISGLRSQKEMVRAFVLILALFLTGVLVGVAGKRSGVFAELLTSLVTAARLFWSLFYDLSLGAIIIFRAVGRQLIDSAFFGIGFAALILLSLIALSFLVKRLSRA